MKDLRSAGFQSREISALVARGDIERVKPCRYRLADYGESGEHADLVGVCQALSDGVICHIIISNALLHENKTENAIRK